MKIITSLVGLLLAGSVCASPALITNSNDASLTGSTTLDFNAEAAGGFTSRTFGGQVTISSSGVNDFYVSNTYSGSYGATGNYVENITTPDPINLSFGSSVTAFGFSWGAADQPWTLDVFDVSNVLLGSFNIAAQSGNYAGFIGVDGGGAAIGSAKLTSLSNYGYDYILIDDLQYVSNGRGSVVPEPSLLALLALGFAGLAFARRTKSA